VRGMEFVRGSFFFSLVVCCEIVWWTNGFCVVSNHGVDSYD
jgi:hypothetical protein